MALVSVWWQLDGLVGYEGITPVSPFLEALQPRLGLARWWLYPTLSWVDTGMSFLHLLCGVGVGSALLLLLGVLPALNALLLWLVYLSLVTVCQPWLGFQWDHLLLEAGFLSIWLAPLTLQDARRWAAPPSPWALWALRWLLVRLMFASGVVKLASGDLTWHNLTALTFHYETQPLPTWVGWYAHQLPVAWQRAATLLMFGIELVVPWGTFAPWTVRRGAAVLLAGMQVVIAITGNYGFFNLLVLSLCLLLWDDAGWPSRWRGRHVVAPQAARPRRWPLWCVVPVSVVVFILSLPHVVGSFRWQFPWPWPMTQVMHWTTPWRTVNPYGLFAVMTTSRPEIILEGSNDGQTWVPYAFAWKPGEVGRRPAFVAPHMPRLDWQMWFAALGSAQRHPWVERLMKQLLRGSPAVLDLLAYNPFPDAPPRLIRAMVYQYHFTDIATYRATGAWWRRERQGLYMPVMPLRR
jgi:hypothetical protein